MDSKAPLKTVVIADDHKIVRQGVVQVLKTLEGACVVGEADNGLSAIALVKAHTPNLLVLDAGMPLARGLDVYLEARRHSPTTKIVLLTGFTSINLLADWLAAGVDGLLLKTCETDEMRTAFLTALEGGSYVAQEVQAMLQSDQGNVSLSQRENQVLYLIASGNANPKIAESLNLSEKTIEKHRASLMKKLGVHTVAELMVYALREGLLDDHQVE